MDPTPPLFGEADPSFTYDAYLSTMDTNIDPLNLDVDIDYLAEESSASTNTTLPRPNLDLSSPISTSASTSTPPTSYLTQAQQQSLVHQRGLVPVIVTQGGSPSGGSGSASVASKQRMERRGHTKSRRGCYNCKRRRIKCQETKPACGHCVKGGLKCEYPSMPVVVHQPQHQIPLFSLQDRSVLHMFTSPSSSMSRLPLEEKSKFPLANISVSTYYTRLYPVLVPAFWRLSRCSTTLVNTHIKSHSALLPALPDPRVALPPHRLRTHLEARGSLPLGKGTLPHPLQVFPANTLQYEYLMHAILGLAASELMSDDPSLLTPAIEHRVKAIRAVKRALTDAPNADTFEEGNALMATCFALTLQSVLVDDGMVEYMTFIRGILIVAIQMWTKGAKLLFGAALSNQAKDALQPYMEVLPLVEQSWVEAAAAAIQGLRPLCENDTEVKYWELILDMTEQLRVSSWEGMYSSVFSQTPCSDNTRLPFHGQALRVVDAAPARRVPAHH